MRKFEQQLKQKAHLNKIKNAKKTILPTNKNAFKLPSTKSDEAQLLLHLYERNRFDSIPAYKLLRTAGLQQYTKGFIERGYGVKLGTLSGLSEKDKIKLYEDLKILPGHTVKLDRLIQTISKHSYLQQDNSSSYSNFNQNNQQILTPEATIHENQFKLSQHQRGSLEINVDQLKFQKIQDLEYQKQLERVFEQYTPNNNKKYVASKAQLGGTSGKNIRKQGQKQTINYSKLRALDSKALEVQKSFEKVPNQRTPISDTQDKKKKTFNDKIPQKKTPLSKTSDPKQYTKTKIDNSKNQQIDFRKKNVVENRPTIKRVQSQQTKSGTSGSSVVSKKMKNLGIGSLQYQTETTKILQINLELDKAKALNRSFDGALMSSTIANIDIEQLVFAFSGYVFATVIAAPQPQQKQYEELEPNKDKTYDNERQEDNIDEQVQNILRESYLHPLYTNQNNIVIDEDIDNVEEFQHGHDQELATSEGEQDQTQQPVYNQFLDISQNKNMQQSSASSFLGGQSYHFGFDIPLHVFNEPDPNELDYFKPTVDSIANFIKNIVLTAKMEREIPIMAAHYLQTFIKKSGIILTSLNYKRILVTLLLLASKIWDDESFESPSFSKTFPEYTTILLNEMQKEVLKVLDYKLKLDKKQFASIYFQLRKFARKNLRSCQNKKFDLHKIRDLQLGQKKIFRTNFLSKRTSF